jgi:hypothetical protein
VAALDRIPELTWRYRLYYEEGETMVEKLGTI